MRRAIVTFAAVSFAAFFCACGSGSSNSGSELPEGINTQRIEPGANGAPGIPSNANSLPGNGAPTPGIPGNSNTATSVPKGATPTPGIPDEETLKRQLERTDIDPNVVNRPSRTVPNSNVKARDQFGRPRRVNPK